MKLTKIIVLMIALIPVKSMAVDYELSLGQTQYKQSNNGTWFQEAFPYTVDLNSINWSAGVSHKFDSVPRVRAEFVNLGKASADAWAVPIDAYYNTNSNECVGRCLPLARFQSSGSVKGIALTIAPEMKFGDFSVFVEGGIYIFRPTYSAVVTNVRWTYEAEPITVYTKHNTTTQMTYVMGLVVRYKQVEFVARYYDVEAADDDVPAVYLGAYSASVRFRF